MKRRTFILSTASVILSRLLKGCKSKSDTYIVNTKSKIITKVVEQLRWIDDERRKLLAQNRTNQSASKLNELIPEIDAIEFYNSYSADPNNLYRLIAWNTERGRNWRDCVRLINEHPALHDPDFIFLGEMDLGMARSANEHTTKEMASALKMNYAYGVEFLELTNGEPQERKMYPGENEWGYHGNAILSKYPLQNLRMIRFPGIERWYNDYQQRLGGRMALFAEVDIGGKTVILVSTHLENLGDDPLFRQKQMKMILQELEKSYPNIPTVIGGDLNATPDEPLFTDLKNAGFIINECNEIGKPTQQILEDGKVKLVKKQIDYIVVKDLKVINDKMSPKIVPAVYPPGHQNGRMLGDHAVVTVKVKLV